MCAAILQPAAEATPEPLPLMPVAVEARRWPAPLVALFALLAYSAIAVAMFANVVAHLWTAFPGDLGDPPSQAWIIAWDVHALLHNPAHLFDANIFYPFHDVLAYQDSLLGLLPLVGPILLLTGSPVAAYNLVFLLTFALCAWGAFLLARYLTGDSRAALLAGLIYGFSAYRMVHLFHLNLLSGMWIPFVLLCWEQARGGRRRYWLGVAIFFVLQALSALYYAVFLAVALSLLTAWHLWRAPRGRRRVTVRRLVVPALATGACCGAALLPFLAPYFRVEHALGQARGLGQAIYFSADLRDFLHSVDLSVLYGWTGRALGVRPDEALQYLWPGALALALALWGLWSARRTLGTTHSAYAVLCAVAALLCLGPFLKVWGYSTGLPLPYLLIYWLPGVAGLRDPARFGAIYTLALAVLAAYGAAVLLRRGGKARLLTVALACGILLESWIRPLPVAAIPVGSAVPPVYRWLASRPAGSAVLELPIGLADKEIWARQAEMMYFSTLHWQPIVNGTGGFAPLGYAQDQPIYAAFPAPATLRLLHRRGVRYVVVHGAWVGGRQADAIRARHVRGVRLVRHWPDADLYALG